MTERALVIQSLRFRWRAHLGVVLGAAVGSAALIGALVVGDSMRGSLREQAMARLGHVWYALAGFLDLWGGFQSVIFDSYQAWTTAQQAEPTRAMEGGLAIDPDWTYSHGCHLFDGLPDRPGEFRSYHLRMNEHIVLPVERPERKLAKLVLFFRRKAGMNESAFEPQVLTTYAPTLARLPGLQGCLLNFRDPDQEAAFRGYYPESAWWNSPEGYAMRRPFCSLWDGAFELSLVRV